MNILYVNACLRGEKSNTQKLCRTALKILHGDDPACRVHEINLNQHCPKPFDGAAVEYRSTLHGAGMYDGTVYGYARRFAAADYILIGAPYWDLSFPAALKIYLEYVCAVGVTFDYAEDGSPVGLCRAKRLLYITTSGGSWRDDLNLGFDYIQKLCANFFGIPDTRCFALGGFDLPDTDIPGLLAQSEAALHLTMGNA